MSGNNLLTNFSGSLIPIEIVSPFTYRDAAPHSSGSPRHASVLRSAVKMSVKTKFFTHRKCLSWLGKFLGHGRGKQYTLSRWAAANNALSHCLPRPADSDLFPLYRGLNNQGKSELYRVWYHFNGRNIANVHLKVESENF